MRRKGLWLSVLATALIAGSASAAVVNSTNLLGAGQFQWFNYTGNAASNTWDGGLATVTGPGILGVDEFAFGPATHAAGGDFTTPGYGDQPFDIEQFFYGYDGNESGGILYIGMLTGFNPYGVVSGSYNYRAGDFFLNINGQGTDYDQAFGTSLGSGDVRLGNSWSPVGSSFSTVNVPSYATWSDPWRVNDTTGPLNTDLLFGTDFDVNWQLGVLGNLNRNLLEVAVRITDGQAEALLASGFNAHWTMECGNDLIPFAVTPTGTNVPLVPVPAAAPLGLLGMGLLALVRRVRRRTEC